MGSVFRYNRDTPMNLLSYFITTRTEYPSAVNGTVVLVENFGRKRIWVQGAPQGEGEFVRMWQSVFRNIGTDPQSVVVLGIGSGTVIRLLRLRFPNTNITAVDNDPVIVDIAKNHFSLSRYHADIQVIDAKDWVKRMRRNHRRFDCVIFDAYIGMENAPGTRKDVFLRDIKHILTAEGYCLFSVSCNPDHMDRYSEMIRRMKRTFPSVREVFAFPFNRIVRLSNA